MPIVTQPVISPELLSTIKEQTEVEKQVIVHCCFQNGYLEHNLIRIWQSTYLVDKFTGYKSQLLFWDNISLYPYWTVVPAVKEYIFTLIFSGLPKDCMIFDFVEEIPQDGGFLVTDIERNSTDVYTIKLG